MDTLQLNQGQQKAADGFFNFLLSKESELIISGPGGVGKTFLMGHLIDNVMPQYQKMCSLMNLPQLYYQVDMTATTNKAAEVLGKATRRPTKTIHSHLNLQVRKDYQTGKTSLAKGRNWEVKSNSVLFVDEASMVDHQLLTAIREGTFQCKIVYVGDHCQLAPVQETLSPIYRAELPFFELTEPMRNADQPALMEVCNQLRATVETGEFHPIRIVPGVIDHLDGEAMEREIAAAFLQPNHQDRILAYTNKRVVAYNDHIRDLRKLPPLYTKGEFVINNTAIITRAGMISVEEELEILDIASQPTEEEIEPGVEMEVVECLLRGNHATHKVRIPVNRAHFEALLKHYQKQKNWNRFYFLQETFPDLRPRDAATVHKAQGSTYETVFIDLSDLSTCHRPNTVARLLYVAFSRARQRVVLYGNLASKYGGLVR